MARYTIVVLISLSSFMFSEDLILNDGNHYMYGDYYYDNIILTNSTDIYLPGANSEQGYLRLYCDSSLYIESGSNIIADYASTSDSGNGSSSNEMNQDLEAVDLSDRGGAGGGPNPGLVD